MNAKDLKRISKEHAEELKNDKEYTILKRLLPLEVAIFLFVLIGTIVIRISQYH